MDSVLVSASVVSPGARAAAGENCRRLAEQISKGIDVVNAVEHDLQAFALIDPRPQTPVGLAVDLNCGIGRSAKPLLIDEKARAADARVPTHLLVDGNFHFGFFGQFHAAHRFGVFIREWLLTEKMFAGGGCLGDDFDLLRRVNRYVRNLNVASRATIRRPSHIPSGCRAALRCAQPVHGSCR